ncbi:MAG: hypothetical protein JXK95_08440 [Bacteroidales bacterium]|nr:hypothetical protein [Bacteroidales bacterium]
MEKLQFLILVCLLCRFGSGRAQGLFENAVVAVPETGGKNRIELNGFARGSVYGGSEAFDYSSVFGEFCLQGKWSGGKAFLFSDIRIRGGLNFGEQYTSFQLKEAYAGYSNEKLDIYLGNQIVIWGRTDGFNPTNNITPNDYFFLSADPDDQKMPNFMLRTRYRFSDKIDIDLIGIPFYIPSVYRYDLFDMGSGVVFTSATMPEKSFKNSSLAARINLELPAVGFAVSWFRGFDPFLGFDVKQIDWQSDYLGITNSSTPYMKNTIGADFSLPAGKWITRGEMAYNHTRDYDTSMYIPAPNISYVAGIERSIGGVTTILQYVGQVVTDFETLQEPVLTDPVNPLAQIQYAADMVHYESALFNRRIFNQQEKTNHALSLSLSKSFAYDTWNVELTGYYNMTSEEYMIRPKISWKATDALSLSAGGYYMNGPEKSVFNYSGPVLNGAFLELKASF